MLNGHGDDLHLAEGPIKYNFSSNVYYKGCPSALLTDLGKNLAYIENYPSPSATELNILAAEKHNLPNDHFLFTNGATEAFYLIAQLFKGKKTAILAPTFSEYGDACHIHGLDVSAISKNKLNNIQVDLVWICNPNNPDGSVFSTKELTDLVRKNPATYFVIDEAYIEFTEATETVIQLTAAYKNIFIVRSLTKTFTIPGLRLGYLAANPALIDQLLAIKMPWSVNSLAIKSGVFIFNNYSKLKFNTATLIKETELFKEQLNPIKWLKVVPGNTSFFLVEIVGKKASDLKQYLIKEHQILIRSATNFKGLKGEFIRLSTQSNKVNNILIQALLKWN